MIAYKFTRPGGVGPFSGFRWPSPAAGRPGEWVDAEAVEPCGMGIHACRPAQLPYWVAAELWEIELEGQLRESAEKVVAPRGRLLRLVEGWTAGGAEDFGRDCALRARDLAAESLADVGQADDAGPLMEASDLGDLAAAARRIAEGLSGLPALLTAYAADAAGSVVMGELAAAGHIAAMAAGDRDAGEARHDLRAPAYLSERARQGAWIRDRFGLRDE